jgi:hypothetical protein
MKRYFLHEFVSGALGRQSMEWRCNVWWHAMERVANLDRKLAI